MLQQIQEPKTLLVVQRNPSTKKVSTVQQANSDLVQGVDWKALQQIASSVGVKDAVPSPGDLYLLRPIVPKTYHDLAKTPEASANYTSEMARAKASAEAVDNPEKRAQRLHNLEQTERLLHLGPATFVDRQVVYNPSPFRLFSEVFGDIKRTLAALLSGRLSPKWLVGPIGIVQVVEENWKTSIKEGLYWIGAISLNLGILNLLPIPVLDGGSICFSLFEMATGKRIKPKTMERMIIPFALLLMTLLLFLTYQDVLRLFGSLLA
jgi:regulator of sigma E protease